MSSNTSSMLQLIVQLRRLGELIKVYEAARRKQAQAQSEGIVPLPSLRGHNNDDDEDADPGSLQRPLQKTLFGAAKARRNLPLTSVAVGVAFNPDNRSGEHGTKRTSDGYTAVG